MTDREKLVELLTDNLPRIGGFPKCDNPLQYTSDEIVERIADHLLANGVTVQRWIPVTERLPENICPVLVVLEGISTAFDGWYYDGKWWTRGRGTRPFKSKVTHWMPLPEPPKEGE